MMDTKRVYVVWTNTDLTEGRGFEIPLAVCETEATAIRLGKGKYVQGCDCRVTEFDSVRHGGYWLAPVNIIQPSKEDTAKQAVITEKRRITAARDAAIEKAKELGLSDSDIAALRMEKKP